MTFKKLSVGLVAVLLPAHAVAQDQPAPPPLTMEPAPTPSPPPSTGGGNMGGQVSQPSGGEPGGGGGPSYQGPVYAPEDQEHYAGGAPPDTHVVARGDTLWDICGYYFSDPWQWPRVWSYNPTITNPHWIYPGDIVRLAPDDGGPVAVAPEPGKPGPGPTAKVVPAVRRTAFDLRQIAFVDNDELEWAGKIVGSPEERKMLTAGDEVYLEYPDKPPQVGQRYAIYSDLRPVKHPGTGNKVGAYVRLHGELQVLEVKKGRRARAQLVYGTDVIERGMYAGPTRTQFKDVGPVPAERDLEGQVVTILSTGEETEELSGNRQVIILDRGSNDGLQVGNRMLVLRRGDGQIKKGKKTGAGMDDRAYPDATRGMIIVVEVNKSTAVALIVSSDAEIEAGDHVLMRQGQ